LILFVTLAMIMLRMWLVSIRVFQVVWFSIL